MAWIHLLGKCRHLSLVRRHFLWLWGFWKRQRMRVFLVRHNREDLVALKELVEAGKVTPVVDRSYELSEVPDALQHQGNGHARGKTVIAM